jgi:glycosidase
MARPAAVRRPVGRGLGARVAAVVLVGLVGSGLAACGPSPAPTPTPSGPPVAVADLPPLAPDGAIDEAGLVHDSRSDRYRTPFGAVPAGTTITLRLRATAGDLTDVTVRVWDELEEIQALVPMQVAASDRTQGEHGYDYWQATIRTSARPTILWYRFIVRDGPTTRYVEDDPAADGGAVDEASDGGAGRVYETSIDASWQIDVYEPDFATPAWAQGALVYQVFPDRFNDGDPTNNPSPDAVQGSDGAAVFRYGDVYGNPVLEKAWDELPEGYCRAYQGVPCDETPLGRDFYGGDLAGITAKLDDLAALGVTVLYLNPVFAAPSNHRYDTSSYDVIDPDLGTQADFDGLVAAAEARGIRVLLDGVFNHVSSDSPWFDRTRRFAEVGACEAADSAYRSWFTFRAPKPNEPAPCAASTAGGDDTYYVGWFGFDTIPEVVEQGDVYDLYTGPDGVVRRWIAAGTAGWRLDVMDNLSHGFMRRIRDAAKATDPDALVMGEQWQDASAWLLGDQADTTMNYRFRRAVIGLVNGDTPDLDGAIAGLVPTAFVERMRGVQEDYPAPAFATLLNLVDSHDTTRILWTLAPGKDDPAVKESVAGIAEAKARLRLVSALQLTWPGMASVYYGTEAGLTGHDDPDDRRPYPWDAVDTELRDWYRTLGQLRLAHASLRTGGLEFVHADDAAGTLAYLRRGDDEAALVVLNLSTEERTVAVDVAGRLPSGAVLTDALAGASLTVGGEPLSVRLPARGAAVLITAPGTDLQAPAAPAGPTATAAAGRVDLAWEPVAGAAGYDVWRSILSGGGYDLVGKTAETTFADTTVRNGTRAHYVLVAVDAAGNASPRSPEADALPRLTIADARLEGPAEVSQPLSAVDAGTPIHALVRVDGITGATGPTIGIRTQLGIGAASPQDPATDYAWSEMAFAGDVDGADRLAGAVRPEELGSFNVVLRVSTDDGATWAYADRGGIVTTADVPWDYRPDQAVTLEAVEGADREPPPAPSQLRVATVAGSSLTLAWEPVAAPDLYRYDVFRGSTPGGPYERIGAATEPKFTDDTVATGDAYVYVVAAVDTSFNRSAWSEEVGAAAQTRPVAVTFVAAVPANTPAADTLFIAGDFQDWDPAATPMTRVDERTWSITLPFVEGDAPQYKFTRGSWEAVEKDAACGEIPNRTVTVTYGTEGAQEVPSTIEAWRDVNQCG